MLRSLLRSVWQKTKKKKKIPILREASFALLYKATIANLSFKLSESRAEG